MYRIKENASGSPPVVTGPTGATRTRTREDPPIPSGALPVGSLLYVDPNGHWALLAVGAEGQALVVSSSVPTWVGLTMSHISGLQAALDAKASTTHRATHASGGTDAFTSSDLLEAVVRRLRETSGPTTLTVGAVADGQFLRRSGTSIVGDTPIPAAHKDTHKSGGSDAFTSSDLLEAVVRRLREAGGPTTLDLGTITDGQFLRRSGTSIIGDTPPVLAHKDTHKSGGTDAFTSSDVLEAVVKRLQESSGPTTLALGSVSDGQFLKRSGTNIVGDTPPVLAHKSTHITGGSDAFTSSDLLEAVVKRLQESSGPTTLTLGSISDGQFLRRSGTTIIGDTPSGGGPHKDTHKSGGSDAFTSSDLLEAVVKRLQESSGPTTLTLGSVSDGQFLRRSGTSIVGDTPSVSAHKDTHKSGGSDAFTSSDLLEAAVKRLQESSGPTTLTLGSVSDGQLLVRSGTSIVGTPRTYQWIGRTTGTALGTTTTYIAPAGVAAADTTETNVTQNIASAVRILSFRVRLTTAPGSGASRTFTLRTNLTDTTISVTISDTAIAGTWTGNELITTGGAGTRLSVSASASGSPASAHAMIVISLHDA